MVCPHWIPSLFPHAFYDGLRLHSFLEKGPFYKSSFPVHTQNHPHTPATLQWSSRTRMGLGRSTLILQVGFFGTTPGRLSQRPGFGGLRKVGCSWKNQGRGCMAFPISEWKDILKPSSANQMREPTHRLGIAFNVQSFCIVATDNGADSHLQRSSI